MNKVPVIHRPLWISTTVIVGTRRIKARRQLCAHLEISERAAGTRGRGLAGVLPEAGSGAVISHWSPCCLPTESRPEGCKARKQTCLCPAAQFQPNIYHIEPIDEESNHACERWPPDLCSDFSPGSDRDPHRQLSLTKLDLAALWTQDHKGQLHCGVHQHTQKYTHSNLNVPRLKSERRELGQRGKWDVNHYAEVWDMDVCRPRQFLLMGGQVEP